MLYWPLYSISWFNVQSTFTMYDYTIYDYEYHKMAVESTRGCPPPQCTHVQKCTSPLTRCVIVPPPLPPPQETTPHLCIMVSERETIHYSSKLTMHDVMGPNPPECSSFFFGKKLTSNLLCLCCFVFLECLSTHIHCIYMCTCTCICTCTYMYYMYHSMYNVLAAFSVQRTYVGLTEYVHVHVHCMCLCRRVHGRHPQTTRQGVWSSGLRRRSWRSQSHSTRYMYIVYTCTCTLYIHVHVHVQMCMY